MSTADIVTSLAGMASSVVSNYNDLTKGGTLLSDNEALNLVTQTMAAGTTTIAGLKGTGSNLGVTTLAVTWDATAFKTAQTVHTDNETRLANDQPLVLL